MQLEISLKVFKEALKTLDEKLQKCDSSNLPIEIRAIGGFALLYHSIRVTGYTADIDSVTEDYPEEVLKCIHEVADIHDLPKDWLNNYNVFENDIESIELMILPKWESVDYGLKFIHLQIANVETLLRAKLIASEDAAVTKRKQDFPDLVTIFRKLRCFTVEAMKSYCSLLKIDLEREYPSNVRRLNVMFAKRNNRPLPELKVIIE